MAEDRPYLTDRTFLFSIQKGQDLLVVLQEFCIHHGIKCGIVSAIGAVEKAVFSIYDQKEKKYHKVVKEEDMEILALNGNISLLDDKPMVHAHISLSDIKGNAHGGHLMAGTRVFSAEVYIQELTGEPKERKSDKSTKLSLWGNPVALK